MALDELLRLKQGFQELAIDDMLSMKSLRMKLENVVKTAVKPQSEADRFVGEIYRVQFTKSRVIVRDIYSGHEEQVESRWEAGRTEMLGVIDGIIHYLEMQPDTPSKKSAKVSVARNKVFVVHGRDHAMLRDVDAFLQRIRIQPVIILDEPSRGGTVVEKVERNADVPFAVVLFSPDDVGGLHDEPRETLKRRPRQNAVLELGFFIGRLGREHTVVLVDDTVDGEVEYPSDLGGVIPIHYRPDSDWKTRLMRELKASDISHDPSKA